MTGIPHASKEAAVPQEKPLRAGAGKASRSGVLKSVVA